ncbi:phosphate ABC transporter permease PstA [Corynebacterium belfantii]|uniref:Phosphate transport system permease protein PstA n=1 Tax=Corynebacterium belfantii TaxID=2014537 RepID=A0ABS0LCT4_9CORY|nr:phosphate ABC transporter permease PstA [Corynebacterium belfantii]STC67652.1 phosphate transport system permease protein pstA 1 [Corynebacterium diphtheriae]MBG9244681.1 phosphate ABC transporter permease PstA [Corynebacterium belfantii]MBG9320100.1 phosphate ABC transporter permease PstA [Corynebacterium belfantii]MBG9326799.1 phosphate ABC transporter permease PstA [Corynebacterium belfantii]MBG9331786.1 phosphate ABC transporter permease PstA [Corynebacterium belfantii]
MTVLFSRRLRNSVVTVAVTLAIVAAIVPLLSVLYTLISHGVGTIITSSWWTSSQKGVMYSVAGGGALHAMIGTLVQTLLCSAVAIPLGVLAAIFLVEYAGDFRLGKMCTFMVDIMTGIPSIVAALFVYSLWIVLLGFERSGIAVSIALLILMVPVVVRTTEEMLRIVPQNLREASLALGVPRWRTIVSVVVPTALPGIITGVMLAIARVMGESAPVLILVGSTQVINWDAVSGPQSSLPLMMLDMFKAGTADAVLDKMWGAGLTLVLLISLLTIGARVISAKTKVAV